MDRLSIVTRQDPQPWPHQEAAVRFALDRPAAMLEMWMGTGKTRTVIDLIQTAGHKRVLVVCPKYVIPVWQQQLDEWLIFDQPAVEIINYEKVWRKPHAQRLRRGGWDLVVADESQKIKSAGSKASRFMAGLTSRSKQRICTTGTPMHDKPLDVYGQFRFLDPTIFGTSYRRFANRYVEWDEDGPYVPGVGYVRIKDYKNLDEFIEKYRSITFTVGKDVLGLPPVVIEIRYCDLGREARRIYRDLERDFVATVGVPPSKVIDNPEPIILAPNVLVKLLRLQQLTGGCAVAEDGTTHRIDDSKRRLLVDILNEIPPDECVTVFATFKEDLFSIRMAAGDAGRDYYEQSGRRFDWQTFQQFAEPGSVIGVQMKAGSAGIDLTRASYAIFYSPGLSYGDYEQAISRLNRPGQTRSVTVIHLAAAKTEDERVYRRLQDKKQTILDITQRFVKIN